MAGTGDTTKKVPAGQEVLPIPPGLPPLVGEVDSQQVTVIVPGRARSASSTGSGERIPETPAAPLPEAPRQLVPGYEVLRELARGGMGVVYEAWSQRLGCTVALKLVQPDLVFDPDTIGRLEREVAAQARLRHPNIVRVLDTGRAQACPWIALELIPGETLEQRLKRQGPLPQPLAAAWTRALAAGLDHAHSLGVLHRDLKPSNVLLGPDDAPRLTDFGLARLQDDQARLTMSGVILGTPAYMAPEQAGAERERIDARTDVYGLGAVLYQMLTGVPPYRGTSQLELLEAVLTRSPAPPSSLRAELDPALEAICLRCLARDPAQRWGSMAELGAALLAWERGAGKRGGGALILAAAAVLSLALASLAVLVAAGKEPAPDPGPTAAPPQPPPAPQGDELLQLLASPPTWANLLATARLLEQRQVQVDARLVPDPELRARALFSLHVQELERDVHSLTSVTSALAGLLRDPDLRGPWVDLASVIQKLGQGRVGEAGAELDGRHPPGDTRLAWAELLRAPTRYFDEPRRVDEARECLERALRLDPGLAGAYVVRAQLELQEGRGEAALEWLRRGEEAAPPAPVCLRATRVVVLRFLSEPEEAADELRVVMAQGGRRSRQALISSAEGHQGRREWTQALADLDAFEALPAGQPAQALQARAMRGQILAGQERWAEASRVYRALVDEARSPQTLAAALRGWCDAEIELGRAEQVLAELPRIAPRELLRPLVEQLEQEVRGARARQVPPAAGRVELERLAGARLAQGDLRGVIAVLDAALARDPSDRSLLLDRAKARFKLGHVETALGELEELERLEGRPLQGEARDLRISVLMKAGRRLDAAAAIRSRLAEADQDEWHPHALLALNLVEGGDLQAAAVEVERLSSRARTDGERAAVHWLKCIRHRALEEWDAALAEVRAIDPALLAGGGTTGLPASRDLLERMRRYLERRVARGR